MGTVHRHRGSGSGSSSSSSGVFASGIWVLPVFVATLAAIGVAFLGATITDLGPWYQALEKPSWTPPDGLFPIVWTLIYALITVAGLNAWWTAPNARISQNVISLFALNGFLSITWSLLFFRLERPDFALIELGALWLSILVMMLYCAKFARTASWLLAPYLAWVTYAGAMNWAVVELNGPFG